MAVLLALDYIVIVLMLAISASIGIYFGCTGGKQRTSEEYFKGDSQMGVLPIAASITVTALSAITYLGTPAEVYVYGPYFGLLSVIKPIVSLIALTCFFPVYYRLNLTSVFEYLNLRFRRPVCYLVLLLSLFSVFIYMGIVVYTPALALSTLTGISLTACILAVGITCTLYTTVGGLKAVVWTDVFQAIIMVLGMIFMIVAGTISYGGPTEGWRRAKEGQRSQLVNFDLDPTVTYSFWSVMIGGTFMLLGFFSRSQLTVQRFNACKSETQAKMAILLGMVGIMTLELLAVATGMTVYAYYAGCDPLASGYIERRDQIVPYYIVDAFQNIPGASGFLIAGAFAASLSSISSLVNGVSAILGEHLAKPFFKLSEKRYTFVVKCISFSLGCSSMIIAFLAPLLGGVLQAAMTIGSIMSGPAFGIYCLGMFFPRGNSIGGAIGISSGLAMGIALKIGSGIYTVHHEKPPLIACPTDIQNTSVDSSTLLDWTASSSVSVSLPALEDSDAVTSSLFFNMSFLYYSMVSSLVTISVGYAISLLTQWTEDIRTDIRLYSPVIEFYPKKMLPAALVLNAHDVVATKDSVQMQNGNYKEISKEALSQKENGI